MKLPSPDEGVKWSEFANTTPTFKLTPVEKPDMSPYLIHLTGKKAIKSILKGEDRPIGQDEGFLKACVPESNQNHYDAKVVCFTDSPTFALDFFRYRSKR